MSSPEDACGLQSEQQFQKLLILLSIEEIMQFYHFSNCAAIQMNKKEKNVFQTYRILIYINMHVPSSCLYLVKCWVKPKLVLSSFEIQNRVELRIFELIRVLSFFEFGVLLILSQVTESSCSIPSSNQHQSGQSTADYCIMHMQCMGNVHKCIENETACFKYIHLVERAIF